MIQLGFEVMPACSGLRVTRTAGLPSRGRQAKSGDKLVRFYLHNLAASATGQTAASVSATGQTAASVRPEGNERYLQPNKPCAPQGEGPGGAVNWVKEAGSRA